MLIDCGLTQGYKQLRLKNWASPPFDPATLDAIVLTHAHIDHSGYVPRLFKRGCRGKVYCIPAIFELCRILLPLSLRNLTGSAFLSAAAPCDDDISPCRTPARSREHRRLQYPRSD